MQKVKMLGFLFIFFSFTLFAQIPSGYYNAAEGKKDASLKTALFNIINDHTQLEYFASATYFRTTDWHPNGYYWDMYSNNKRSYWSGGVINREHSMPKSWFGIASGQENSAPIGSDLHNLYPSDATANSAKSNYPLGETNGNDFNNSVSKVGSNTFSGYNGIVFEPADEYKGDFARTYMYMVTRYEDYVNVWQSTGTSSMLYRSTYPTFRPYAVNILLKWHRNDQVSEKELNRNNEVYKLQGNRNPFIDHPVLAEYIWGYNKGETWDSSVSGYPVNEIFHVHYKRSPRSITAKLTPASNSPYMIFSMSGQMLLSGTLSTAISTTIPIQELGTGSYLFMVQTESNRHVRVFVVY